MISVASFCTNLRPWASPGGLKRTARKRSISVADAPEEIQTKAVEFAEDEITCVGTGTEVECLIDKDAPQIASSFDDASPVERLLDVALLISPFFFWGTSMVVMKLAAPHTTPLFVGFIRLFPAGLAVLAWAATQKRPQPSSSMAWLAITLFGIVDGACFQGFLAEGLQRTTAGLGSIIIDSQPLSVAVLAALFYNETFTWATTAGLGLGFVGLCFLQLPQDAFMNGLHLDLAMFQDGSIWERGEWWMLLAAQSMAIGTVMVRWLTQYCDPVMATGWHMVIGSAPLLFLCLTQETDLSARLSEVNGYDVLSLAYVALLGSAASYGVFFYNASKGNLTALSSLTFLTPVFATITGFLVLNETLTPMQLIGAVITLAAVFFITSTKQQTK